jgi:SAM-dependent methyltransferase
MPLADAATIARADLAAAGAALSSGGWTDEACLAVQALMSRLGDPPAADVGALLEGSPTTITLTRLWGLGLAVPAGDARAALGDDVVTTLLALGLLNSDGPDVRAELSILPSDGYYTTRDFYSAFRGRPIGADYVLGIGPSTRTLASLIPRTPVERALDVGTGQGFLALLMSAHASRVIATDINPRALSAAALAAGLSGARNIELREGSFFEPLAHEPPFDLIASNPPFVIQPPSDRVCFSAHMQGDACMEHIVRRGAPLLREGGYLCVIGNWTHRTQDDWGDKPAQWAAGAGCDVMVLRSRWWTPRAYAKGWISELSAGGSSEGLSLGLDDWLAHYQRLGIDLISMGVVILRRRSGINWVRADSVALENIRGHAGDQIARLFDNQTLLLSGADVLALPLAPAESLEVVQRHRPTPGGGFAPHLLALRQTEGLDFEMKVQAGALELLTRLDGVHSAAQAVIDLARHHAVDPGPMLQSVRPLVESLLAQGFVRVSA